MKDNKNDVGIISIGNYLPCNAIDTSTIVKFWKNSSLYFIENEIGCLKHRVLGSDEDIIAMSVQSINNMINSYPNSIDNKENQNILKSLNIKPVDKKSWQSLFLNKINYEYIDGNHYSIYSNKKLGSQVETNFRRYFYE